MSIIARYLATRYLHVFAMAMAAACGLFLVIDVFDRLGQILPFDPSWSKVVVYFLFKLPKIVFDIYPAASLLAALISIGILSRHREILALRACGVSTLRLAAPIVAVAALTSVFALVWNETLVPVAASRSRWLWDVELKQKVYRGVFDAASLWFQSKDGFVHIARYDAGQRVIRGLTLYESDPSFTLQRIVEVDEMRWSEGAGWLAERGVVKDLLAPGGIEVRPLAAGEFHLSEDPDNLTARKRRSEEFSFRQLRDKIALLESKGLGAEEFLVDLHHKLAWPFSGFVVALLGVPLALRRSARGSIAANVGVGLVVGFSYWVLTGLALSAGRTGGLSPGVAAWTANVTFSVLAAFFYVSSD